MKVAVTGGAGFIGSHLVDLLVDKGYEVTVIDSLTTGSVDNLRKAMRSGKVELIKGDTSDFKLVLVALQGVDTLFHLAAVVGVTLATRRPLEVLTKNISGIMTVLKASHERKVRRVIFGSSSEVYGDAHSAIDSENLPLSPVSPYGVSKITGEAFCDAFYKKYGLESCIVRLFNVYGPRQNFGMKSWVVPNFMTRAIRRLPIVVHGKGTQTRDFTYVSDAVKGIHMVSVKGEGNADVYNIATGEETTMLDLASKINAIAGNDAGIVHTRLRRFHIERRCGDISLARSHLGYEPSVDLVRGLRLTYRYYLGRSIGRPWSRD